MFVLFQRALKNDWTWGFIHIFPTVGAIHQDSSTVYVDSLLQILTLIAIWVDFIELANLIDQKLLESGLKIN